MFLKMFVPLNHHSSFVPRALVPLLFSYMTQPCVSNRPGSSPGAGSRLHVYISLSKTDTFFRRSDTASCDLLKVKTVLVVFKKSKSFNIGGIEWKGAPWFLSVPGSVQKCYIRVLWSRKIYQNFDLTSIDPVWHLTSESLVAQF